MQSLINHQHEIETLYASFNQTSYYKELIDQSGVLEHLEQFNLDSNTLTIINKLLLITLQHIKSNPETILSFLSYQFDSPEEASSFLETCIETYDILDWDGRFIYTKIALSEDSKAKIDAFGYPLPLVIKPQYLVNNSDSAYYSIEKSSALQSNAYSDNDLNLDILNQLNSIPLTFDDAIYQSVPYTRPKKPEQESAYRKFTKYLAHSRKLLTTKIYLTWGYDRRGRIYSRSYHYNPQGMDWNKATMQFKETFINKE